MTDIDVLGHVNNAAYWCAVEQDLGEVGPDLRFPACARLDYRHPIDLDEDVALAPFREDGRYLVAFTSGAVVKAVASIENI